MTAKKLKVFDWPKEKRGVRSSMRMRMVKMIEPRCEECPKYFGWQDDCPHDPFHGLAPVKVATTSREVDPDTGLVIKEEKVERITHYRHTPNVVQVVLSLRVNSGLGVEAALAKGRRFPQDVQPTLPTGEYDPAYTGYAPMCEFQNCYAPNPTVRAMHEGLAENRMVPPERRTAFYCSERHARLAKQKDTESVTREVFDPTRQREQLQAVTLP